MGRLSREHTFFERRKAASGCVAGVLQTTKAREAAQPGYAVLALGTSLEHSEVPQSDTARFRWQGWSVGSDPPSTPKRFLLSCWLLWDLQQRAASDSKVSRPVHPTNQAAQLLFWVSVPYIYIYVYIYIDISIYICMNLGPIGDWL